MARKTYEFQLASAGLLTRATEAPRQAITSDLPTINRPIVPAILYARNVLPSNEGFDSIDRLEKMPIYSGGGAFDNLWKFTSSGNTNFYFIPAQGQSFIAQDGDGEWTPLSLTDNTEIPGDPSNAFLRGKFYVFFPQKGVWIIDGYDAISVATTGLIVSSLLGIVGAASYLVAYDAQRIYYTSSFNGSGEPDFTPSPGVSGTERILEIRGSINFCLPIPNGFILYCSDNAVAAQYTGNPNKPFTYREIPGSAGVLSYNDVAVSNLGSHFAWTKSGFQEIRVNGTQNIFPELNTFFKDRIAEDFNVGIAGPGGSQPSGNAGIDTTGTAFTGTGIGFQYVGQINKLKVRAVGNRYITVSYGIEDFLHEWAWVYDLDLKKWGKIDQRHTDIFAWDFGPVVDFLSYLELDTIGDGSYEALAPRTYNQLVAEIPAPRDYSAELATLSPNGRVLACTRFDINKQDEEVDAELVASNSAIVLGRFTALRQTGIQIHEFEAQAVIEGTYCNLFYSRNNSHRQFDGLVHGYLRELSDDGAFWNFRTTAREMALGIEGRFNLTTAFITMERASGRRGYQQRAIPKVSVAEASEIVFDNQNVNVDFVLSAESSDATLKRLKYYLLNDPRDYDNCAEHDGVIIVPDNVTEFSALIEITDEQYAELNDTFYILFFAHLGLIDMDLCANKVEMHKTIMPFPIPPEITLEFASYDYTPGAANITVRVLRTEDDGEESDVDYTTVDGTATAGVNYTLTSGTLHFDAGEFEKNIVIPILTPEDYDDTAFTLEISNPTFATLTPITEATINLPSKYVEGVTEYVNIQARFFALASSQPAAPAGTVVTLNRLATDIVILYRPSHAADGNMVYDAWSPWGSDSGHATPWTNFITISNQANAVIGVLAYWGTTIAISQAAAEAAMPQELTGNTQYKFWHWDTPITDNRGGQSLKTITWNLRT